jgi:hypothetical protein
MVASETKTNKKLIAVDVDLPIGLTFALPFSTAHSGQSAARPPLPLPWSHAFQPLLSNRRGKQSVHTVPGASLYQTSRRLRFLDLIPAGLLPFCHDSVDVLVAFSHLTIDVLGTTIPECCFACVLIGIHLPIGPKPSHHANIFRGRYVG